MLRCIWGFVLFVLCGLPLVAQDMTLIITQGGLPYQSQTWFSSGRGEALQQDEIREYWDKDYYITSAAYTYQGWLVTMCKNCGYTGQSYYYSGEWPGKWLDEKLNDGYAITSLASNYSRWFVVVSKNSDYTAQAYGRYDSDDVFDVVSECWRKGYYITSAAYTGSDWWLVMSKGCGITEQRYAFTPNTGLVESTVQDFWKDGYNLTLMEYGGGEYFIVASKSDKISADVEQSYQVFSSSSAKEFIREKWDSGQDILYVGGGYGDDASKSSGDKDYVALASSATLDSKSEFVYACGTYQPYSYVDGSVRLGETVKGEYKVTVDVGKRNICAAEKLNDGSGDWVYNFIVLEDEVTITKDGEGKILLFQFEHNVIIQGDSRVWIPDLSQKGECRLYDCSDYGTYLLSLMSGFDDDTDEQRMKALEKALRSHGYRISYRYE